MFLFDEKKNVTLDSTGLAVDRSPVRGGGGATTLPEGSNVDAFLIHADKVGDTETSVAYRGTHTFEEPSSDSSTAAATSTPATPRSEFRATARLPASTTRQAGRTASSRARTR
jgi:hypothetical protein